MAVLLLPDAKAYLNITVEDSDTTLAAIIASAEAAITRKCGPLEPTAVTERVVHRGGELLLSTLPVVSLTSVTPDGGAALSLTGLYVDPAGVVTGLGAGTYDVVYSAGRATCPADLLLAVKELVRHLFGPQRGPTGRPGSRGSETTANTIPGAAYMMPFRVAELIAPHVQPGFA